MMKPKHWRILIVAAFLVVVALTPVLLRLFAGDVSFQAADESFVQSEVELTPATFLARSGGDWRSLSEPMQNLALTLQFESGVATGVLPQATSNVIVRLGQQDSVVVSVPPTAQEIQSAYRAMGADAIADLVLPFFSAVAAMNHPDDAAVAASAQQLRVGQRELTLRRSAYIHEHIDEILRSYQGN